MPRKKATSGFRPQIHEAAATWIMRHTRATPTQFLWPHRANAVYLQRNQFEPYDCCSLTAGRGGDLAAGDLRRAEC